jgi:hypothetical protein
MLLCIYYVWVLKERWSAITNISSMNMCFILKTYGQGRKIYNNGVCVKGSTSNEYEVDYYKKLEEVIKL